MSSQLATIISTIVATPITVTINAQSVAVAAVGLEDLPENMDSWRLPQRLILPIGAGRAQGQLQQFATFKSGSQGGVIVVDWTLSDILFFRGADAGIGLKDSAPVLIDYCAAYMSSLGALRTNTWSVTSVTFPIIGAFEWPEGGRTYDGVQVQLVIREII